MQRTIDIHISKLLYHHECVVIPSFGAFITRQYSAEVNASTHMFRPAGKRVSFNARINQNDGLLASYISKTEGISYNEALESINISVRGWKRMLRSGKKVHLPQVGRLYMDNESKLQFSPSLEVNYDVHAFGLGIFRAPSVQREAAIEQGISKVIEHHKKVKGDKTKYRPLLRWAAVLAPLVALGIYTTTVLNPIKGGSDLSSLLPFMGEKQQPVEVIEAIVPHRLPEIEIYGSAAFFTIEEDQEDTIEPSATNEVGRMWPKTDKQWPAKRVVTKSPVVVSKSKAAEVRETEQASEELSRFEAAKNKAKFHIIVGSFKEEENARKYIGTLKGMELEPYIAKGSSSYYRVAVQGFNTRGQADRALNQIKAKVNSAAWVYRN